MSSKKFTLYGGIGRLLSLSFIIFHLSFSPARAQKIGLVLGGGGAKGGAEVGVLKVLEEAGIRPDYIVGTSIGSIVGGLYAAGYTASELEEMFSQQEWLSLLTDRRADLSGEPFKVLKGVTYIIDSMLSAKGCVEFDCLPSPFRCVAASMRNAEEVVLSRGTLPKAIRASMAIPGIFKPVEIDGEKLVDGGMMNNLPVDVCREMGADIIIAVDLQQEKPQNRKSQEGNFITSLADIVGLGPIANWVLTRPDITKYNENRQRCDIYINPPLPDYDASSFGNESMVRMIAVGEQSARSQLPDLRKLPLNTQQ